MFSDYRLNPQLQRACKADISKFCPSELAKGSNPTELEGQVIKCLKVKFVVKVSYGLMCLWRSGYRFKFPSADVFHLSGHLWECVLALYVAQNKINKIILKLRLDLWGHELRNTSQHNHESFSWAGDVWESSSGLGWHDITCHNLPCLQHGVVP